MQSDLSLCISLCWKADEVPQTDADANFQDAHTFEIVLFVWEIIKKKNELEIFVNCRGSLAFFLTFLRKGIIFMFSYLIYLFKECIAFI